MNKKTLLFSFLALAVLAGAATISSASAQSRGWFGGFGNVDPEKTAERQSQMFEQQADLLGVNVDKIKEYWAQGKNMKEIAEELGLSQEDLRAKTKELRQENMQQHLQSLVDSGVITQEQADSRIQIMESGADYGKFGHGKGGCRMGGFENQ